MLIKENNSKLVITINEYLAVYLFFICWITFLEKRLVEKHVSLTAEEFEHIRLVESTEEGTPNFWIGWIKWLKSREPFLLLEETTSQAASMNFTGYRKRTKDILLSFMYKQEISCWIEEAALEEEQQEPNLHPAQKNSRQSGALWFF